MIYLKRVPRSNLIHAYSAEDLLPNEGWVLEANLKIDSAIKSVGSSIQQGVEHVFGGSGGGTTTATAAAVGFYAGGPYGAAGAATAERAAACFNCHVGQPVYDTLSK